MQCVLTPGDKWMPISTEEIAMVVVVIGYFVIAFAINRKFYAFDSPIFVVVVLIIVVVVVIVFGFFAIVVFVVVIFVVVVIIVVIVIIRKH